LTSSCSTCGRPGPDRFGWESSHFHGDARKAYVVHDYHGCDTGCCGHRVIVERTTGEYEGYWALSDHPNWKLTEREQEEWAREIVHSVAPDAPFSWESCNVSND
jgi:hypothetical protein